jgi:hypothetical protein
MFWCWSAIGARGEPVRKPSKQLKKQAERAERAARSSPDEETAASMLQLADAYRTQATVLKKRGKKKTPR